MFAALSSASRTQSSCDSGRSAMVTGQPAAIRGPSTEAHPSESVSNTVIELALTRPENKCSVRVGCAMLLSSALLPASSSTLRRTLRNVRARKGWTGRDRTLAEYDRSQHHKRRRVYHIG